MAHAEEPNSPARSLTRLAAKPFVGREGLLSVARSAIAETANGRGKSLVFSGEPGIGKTRLSDEILTVSQQHGLSTFSARCHAIEGAPALWPWIQIIRSALDTLSDDERGARRGANGAVLGRLLERDGTESSPAAAVAAPDRFDVFDAVTRLLERVAADGPMLLLIDDLHWSDPASAMLLQFAIRELRHAPVLFVALYRHTDLVPNDALSRTIDAVINDSETFRLEGFDANEIRELVHEVVGYEMEEIFHAALLAHTGGNPLFAVEVIRLLLSEGRMGTAERAVPDPIPLPPNIRTVIERRVESIGGERAAVLRQACLLGREFDRDLLEQTEFGPQRTRESLEAGIDAGLLERVGGLDTRIRFTHDVVREVLERTLSPAEQIRFHRSAADAIRRLRSSGLDAHYAQLAAHLLASASADADDGEPDRPLADAYAAYDYLLRAARQAEANYSFEVSCVLTERSIRAIEAVERLDSSDATRDECLRMRGESLIRLADARWQSGLAKEAGEADHEAERIALRRGDPILRARAILGLTGRNDLPLDPPPEHARWLAEAYEALPDVEAMLRLRLLAQRVRSSSFGDLGDELIRWAEECERIAESLDDPWARFVAWDAMRYALLPAQHLEARIEVSRSLPTLARRLGSPRLEALALLWRIFDRLQIPDRAGADRDARRLRALAERMRRPFWIWLATGVDACFALLDGDLEKAEGLVFEALEIGRRAQTPNAVLFFGTQLFHLRAAQERAGEMLDLMERIERDRPGLPVFRIGIPLIHALLDHRRDAQRTFDSVAAKDFEDVPDDFHRLPMLTACARVAAYLGDVPRARRLRELLAPFEGSIVMAGVATFWAGPVDKYLAVLEESLGDDPAAARLYGQSVVLSERAGSVLDVAASLLGRARVLRRMGTAEYRIEAEELTTKAGAIHARLGVTGSGAPLPFAPPASGTGSSDTPAGQALGPRSPSARFTRHATGWHISFGSDDVALPDSKGLAYLYQLLSVPDREVHVLDLVAAHEGRGPSIRVEAGRAGPVTGGTMVDGEWDMVDERALAAYRARLRALAHERSAAESDRDLARLDMIDDESSQIEEELRRVTGLGGRVRTAGSSVEKARKSVYNRIRAAIERISETSPELARHLDRSVTTGRACAYRPETPIDWKLHAN